ITSSKEGEEIKFTANINFKEYFEQETEVEDDEENGIIKGEYTLINQEEDKDEHYTIIKLIGLKESVIDILNGKQYLSKLLKERKTNYLFENMKELMQFHKKNK